MFVITVEKIEDGFIHIEVKKPFGTIEKREFSLAAFVEYLGYAKNYCEFKGYSLIVNQEMKCYSCNCSVDPDAPEVYLDDEDLTVFFCNSCFIEFEIEMNMQEDK